MIPLRSDSELPPRAERPSPSSPASRLTSSPPVARTRHRSRGSPVSGLRSRPPLLGDRGCRRHDNARPTAPRPARRGRERARAARSRQIPSRHVFRIKRAPPRVQLIESGRAGQRDVRVRSVVVSSRGGQAPTDLEADRAGSSDAGLEQIAGRAQARYSSTRCRKAETYAARSPRFCASKSPLELDDLGVAARSALVPG